jgi:sulfur-oxidizing protein SoxB
MVRVAGLSFSLDPHARVGARVFDLRFEDAPLRPTRRYKVAGWASVAENVTGEPVWDVVARYLRSRKLVAPLIPYRPRLVGLESDAGIAE